MCFHPHTEPPLPVYLTNFCQVASSPETYVKRQKEREKAKQQRNKQMKEMLEARRAEREGEECTFEPGTRLFFFFFFFFSVDFGTVTRVRAMVG